ncbi:MAG: S9 family peptidase [Tissierellia bacterium]|nr:S9 family peptidase [Tissierellia bacterium]
MNNRDQIINRDTLEKFQYLSNLESSNDGTRLYFTKTTMKMEDNQYCSHIFQMNTKTKEIHQLTGGDNDGAFIELEDGDLLFTSAREKENENTQFYRLPRKGGEGQKEFEIDYPVQWFREIAKDYYLMVLLFDREKELLKMKYEGKEKPKDEKDYEVLTEIPYWSNGQGFTSGVRSRLALYKKGEKIQFISDDHSNFYGVELSPKKDRFLALKTEIVGKMPLTNTVVEYDFKKESFTTLSEGLSHSYANYLNEGVIILGTDMKNLGINENDCAYFFKDGNIKKIAEEVSHWNSVGTDLRYGGSVSERVNGDKFYYVGTDEYRSILYSMDENGKVEEVLDRPSIDGFVFAEDEIYTIEITETRAQEIYHNNEVLTDFNAHHFTLSPTEVCTFENDGYEFKGFVKYPLDYEPGKKYPVILSVHGGPKTVYGNLLNHEMEMMAARGYFVIYTNPRGSDGRGNAFSDIRGKYGEIDYEDLMAFTDYCLEHYEDMDKDNLFMTGGSYGGFMANWIVGHTHRFNAVCSQRSISNWVSMYGTTDIGYYFASDQNADATPWNRPEVLWDHSPLKYADRVKTPVLFIHSDEDYRCWLAEGLQMFTALKYHGVEARLVLFHGENHELSRSGKPLHRRRRLEEMLRFFDDHQKIGDEK